MPTDVPKLKERSLATFDQSGHDHILVRGQYGL